MCLIAVVSPAAGTLIAEHGVCEKAADNVPVGSDGNV